MVENNRLLQMLSGGDLRSDGQSTQVAGFVLENHALFVDLFSGLNSDDDVIRGRSADALEKIGRMTPHLFLDHVDAVLDAAMHDPVPMVRWHLAMLAGHLAVFPDLVDSIAQVLFILLQDESIFVVSWSIVSLCIICRKSPKWENKTLNEISALKRISSAAIRTKVRIASQLLTDVSRPFPQGWVKSELLTDI